MGTRYCNLTLYRVNQEELCKYLSEIGLDAYVSPTVNDFTVLYEIASINSPDKLPKYIQLDPHLKTLLQQYRDGLAIIVYLSWHLSKKFNCSVLAVFVFDSLNLWYHLFHNGQMLDEYLTCGSPNWKAGEAINKIATGEIKGGNALKLCSAFDREDAIAQVEKILCQPVEFYSTEIGLDARERHEKLAKALGIRPCWVVGMNYLCCTGEDDFEANYLGACSADDPPLEEAINVIRKTLH